MSYGPWMRMGPALSPERLALRRRRLRWFAAMLSVLVQLPFVAATGWHLTNPTLLGPTAPGAALAHSAQYPPVPAGIAFALTTLGLLSGLCLLLPWRGPAIVAATALAAGSIAFSTGPPVAVLAVAFVAVRAVQGRAGSWVWCSLAGLGTIGIVAILTPLAASSAGRVLACTVLLCIVAGVSTGIGARRERFQAIVREETAERRSAAEEERLRIARELHDVLSHSLSQISVQAGVGLHLFDDDPERARESLRSIRTTSTSALDEVRAVLGVLRGPEGTAPHTPAPALDALPALVAEATAAGQRVTLHTAPDAATTARLPSAVQSACYRIVQEALTNARRHAPGASVRVDLDAQPQTVRLVIANGPPPGTPARSSAGGPGRGLLGMRERAAALGGSVTTTVMPDGGFRVEGVLPLPQAATKEGTGEQA
jgi:signal transduction histidine kinase